MGVAKMPSCGCNRHPVHVLPMKHGEYNLLAWDALSKYASETDVLKRMFPRCADPPAVQPVGFFLRLGGGEAIAESLMLIFDRSFVGEEGLDAAGE
jgi:hypothetical protein